MKIIPHLLIILSFLVVFSNTLQSQSSPQIEVMTWVPPYAVAACQTAVQADFGTCDVKDGVTRIGLQFWTPNTNGTIKYANHESYVPSDADVTWWKNWGAANNIPILLCIYNNIGSWDWNLAVSAFATNRTTFVNALIAELDRLDLDGIDLDLEGIGSLNGDRAAFNLFVQELSVQLKARGKILTIDTFHYILNAPNQSWWPDWVGLVDNIHSMGYQDLFEGATTAYGPYSYQQSTGIAAGYHATTVSMGLPSWLSSWGTSTGYGTTAQAHIQELRLGLAVPTGIAIWDLQLQGWSNSDLWCEIAMLKAVTSCPPSGTLCNDNNPNTSNDIEDGNCNCAGVVCQPQGTVCDDLDLCTINDQFDDSCNCAGTFEDSDNDSVCDNDDVCSNFDDTLIGTGCDDNDNCTINDLYTSNCNCAGTFEDSDNDSVCDNDDICAGYDDSIDDDNDSIPDGCDDCISSITSIDGCAEIASSIELSIANTSGGSYAWYDVATGGTVLGSGITFNTPVISTTTTYYAADESSFSTTVAPPTNSNGFTGINDWVSPTQLSFDVLQNFTLKAMTIRALIWSGTHSISFDIRDNDDNLVANGSQSFSITGTQGAPFWHTINLSNGGVDLGVGSYTITVTSAVGIGHWTNVNYPISDNYISITGSDQNAIFLALHDWQIEGGSGNCDRIPVVAQIGNCNSALSLEATVFLHGPYDQNNGLMKTILNTNNRIPLNEPFTEMGWHTGTEQTNNIVLSTFPVVDWVLVELRNKSDNSQALESQSALLLEDGKVVGVDGSSPLYWSVPADDYIVAIHHRNHLAVMTSMAIQFSGTTVLDFTSLSLYGGNNASKIIGGIQTLWAGDSSSSGEVDAADRSLNWNNRNQTGYLVSDCNLDGIVDASDRSFSWNNRNRTSFVP